ncbi:hypothetical protein JG688_00016263 [Phytophthora aleatoria]|uniref:Uncharacterized protein n=1 Tax=Phytophthora aleatoria TaxID=2496075 RepID=A0A8J5MCJ9_9STRA|nr:hypothetical protein JG688_00016263 [Phytophthora aleatoria]
MFCRLILHWQRCSLKRTYGKSLSNFPPCFFGGSYTAPPTCLRVTGRSRSGGRRDGQGGTGLSGAGLRGCGVRGIDQGGEAGHGDDHDSGRINADQGGDDHRRNRLSTIRRGGASRRREQLHRGAY